MRTPVYSVASRREVAVAPGPGFLGARLMRRRTSATEPESIPARQPAGYGFAQIPVHAPVIRTAPRFLEVPPASTETTEAPPPVTEKDVTTGQAGEAMPLEEGGQQGSGQQQQQKSPGPQCGEKIDWQPQSPVPVEITADTAVEFAGKVDKALGGNPHTQTEMSWDVEFDDKDKVSKVNMVVKTTIVRPRYGGGRASDSEKALIGRVVDFIKAHEERHRDIARSVSQQAVCDVLGQSRANAQKILKKAMCDKEPTAQETLDSNEGKIDWVKDSSGAVTDFKAIGTKANYHDPKCK
jgi:hypothetical protein